MGIPKARINVGVSLGLLCVLAAISAFVLLAPRQPTIYWRGGGNEGAAIGALKTVAAAQSLFRESDKEADGNLDYGTLSELASAGTTGLIDRVLGSGTKQGYLFEATYGASTSEFIWFATAGPALPGTTGDRYFCANHEGVTFYTSSGPFKLNSVNCTIPAGAKAVGR